MITVTKMTSLIGPLILVLSGYILGFILEKTVLVQLMKITQRNKWQGDEIIVEALKGRTQWAFFIAGVYSATISFNLHISARQLGIIHKVLEIAVILIVTSFISRASVGLIKLYNQRDSTVLPSVSIFTNLVRIIIFVIGILVVLQTLGISITPILTALGVGGLAVALALQDTLTNLFSGLYIIASRQIKPNDYVKLNSGEEGFVIDISWRSTTIRALANNWIIIPNAKLAGAIITNYQKPEKELSVSVELSVSYDSDLEQVEAVTLEVAREIIKEMPGAVKKFEPAVRFNAFEESGVKFAVTIRAKEFVDQFILKHELIKRLHLRYRNEGIAIPYPTRTVFLKSNAEKS